MLRSACFNTVTKGKYMNVYTAGAVDVALKPVLLLKALVIGLSEGCSCYFPDDSGFLVCWWLLGEIYSLLRNVFQPAAHKASSVTPENNFYDNL